MWFADNETLKGLDRRFDLRDGSTLKLATLWIGVFLTDLFLNDYVLSGDGGMILLLLLLNVFAINYLLLIFIQMSFNKERNIDLFSGRYLGRVWNLIITNGLTIILTIFGLILFIFPGFILFKRYLFAPIISVVNSKGPLDSLSLSKKISDKVEWKIVLIYIFIIVFFGTLADLPTYFESIGKAAKYICIYGGGFFGLLFSEGYLIKNYKKINNNKITISEN